MDDYFAYIFKRVDSKNIAMLMGVDAHFDLVKIHFPTVECDPTGDPMHITGCPTNVQGEFSMIMINIKTLNHFTIIDTKGDLQQSQCAKQPLTTELRKDTIRSAEETATVTCFPR